VLNKLLAKLCSTKVGVDEFGNEYYVGPFKNYLGKNKRFVIYNGIDLSSKVPPKWHAWLHYMSDALPSRDEEILKWQKGFEPNLTGTKYAYDPSKLSDKSSWYKNWTPGR
jgi:NADH:ubiquinone oxidoreductase subunit